MFLIPCFDFADEISFYGFVDGSYRHTLNHSSTTWVLYSQAHDLVSSGSICIGPTTNNIVEYHAIIGFLTEATLVTLIIL